MRINLQFGCVSHFVLGDDRHESMVHRTNDWDGLKMTFFSHFSWINIQQSPVLITYTVWYKAITRTLGWCWGLYNVLVFYHPARASVFLSFVWVTRARNSLLFSSCPFSFFRTICLFTQNSTKKMTYMYVRFNEDISCSFFSKKKDMNHTILPKNR